MSVTFSIYSHGLLASSKPTRGTYVEALASIHNVGTSALTFMPSQFDYVTKLAANGQTIDPLPGPSVVGLLATPADVRPLTSDQPVVISPGASQSFYLVYDAPRSHAVLSFTDSTGATEMWGADTTIAACRS